MSLSQYFYSQFSRPRGLVGQVTSRILALRPSNRARALWTLSLLDLRPGHTLLDVGCGPGVALKIALAAVPLTLAVGLDHSKTVLKQADRRLTAEQRAGRVELLQGTLEAALLRGRRFDRICSMNVIQFFPDRAQALERLKGLLNPGGRLATTYQPRGANPTREAAMAMGESLAATMVQLGFVDVRVEMLELAPAPAICVVGDLSPPGDEVGARGAIS